MINWAFFLWFIPLVTILLWWKMKMLDNLIGNKECEENGEE